MKDVEMLEQLSQIDWWYVLIALVLLLLCIKLVWSGFDWLFIEKLGIKTKKMIQRQQESELLKDTAAQLQVTYNLAKMNAENLQTVTDNLKTTTDNLDTLQKRHCKDEEEFRNNLNNYMKESREDRKALHEEMKVYSNNRINDRKQSLEIQKELKDSIAARDVQINSLVDANKEMLAAKINEKYKYYISINGIPEDEYDEFVSLHAAYKGVGGNSHGDAKFEYCMEHLPIIPVDTKLVIKHKEN